MNRGFLTLAALACLGFAAPAAAGTLFRCDGPDGARSYSSTKVSGARCSAVETGTVNGGGGSTSSAAASGPRRVSGQVYAYIEDGVRHYSSVRPRGGTPSALETIRFSYMETCYACAAKPGVDFGRVRLNPTAFDSEIASASSKYGVDEAVVRAIIHAESSFNPKARSRVGAQGLMQLMPATARRFGVELDPESEVVVTMGSKEGLASLATAITAPSRKAVMPSARRPRRRHAAGGRTAGGLRREPRSGGGRLRRSRPAEPAAAPTT